MAMRKGVNVLEYGRRDERKKVHVYDSLGILLK